MKKKELKKRIKSGFSQLSPDIFEAVLEESSRQETVWSEAETEESLVSGKIYTRGFSRYALSLCASLAVICLCIFGVLGQREKSVYMVIDINPSIQIEMNEAHQVKRLKGLNQDGKDVVKELRWRKKESVQEVLDVLIQDVVEKSYLRENEGILVTLAAPDRHICENLERTLGEGIDRKLTELKVSGVTTAFQEVHSSSEKEGRKLLEAELTKNCGLDEKQVQEMSVRELIQYCQDYTSLELRLSKASEKERAAQQKEQDKSQTQEKPSSGESSGKKAEDSTTEKTENNSDKNEQKPKETEKESSKDKSGDGKPESGKDNQEVEGDTNDQKPVEQDGPVSLGDAVQTEATPPDPGISAEPVDGNPLALEGALGQQENGSQSGTGTALEQTVTPGQSGGQDTPGQTEPQTQPGIGDISGDTPAQPDAGVVSGDTPTQPLMPRQENIPVCQERYAPPENET